MPDDAPRADDSLWRRVAQLDAQLASVEPGDFARRAELTAERAAVVQRLRREHADDGQLTAWAAKSNASDPGRSAPYIPSHSEGGGT